ncbi:PRC-barrel domain-containing protein [Natronorubrum texcoconense]|uniref:Sporulation protein YlmC, PRC-barrel domain family n=1 Tax=Natronorubrum texcoconense TaxID=1095776 RepID=A0A1G8UQ13_9EURY|nr:PRC-barrel domain-containing protein [Natronorubrum texcoconense]SDJ55868.1 Sporulation protein YlmC, PRC-barrel domain family [Natronorubrum texcoconense]
MSDTDGSRVMVELLAKSLTKKSVVGVDGVDFGTVHNLTLNTTSGKLNDLVVDPSARIKSRSLDFETDENGRLLVPVDRIRVVKDTIVVDY